VLQRLWWVIGMVPTQGQMVTAFQESLTVARESSAADVGAMRLPKQGWKQFLYSGGAGNTGAAASGARALYALQTLDHTLQPSPELLKGTNIGVGFPINGNASDADAGVASKDAQTMKQLFVSSGGFASLLEIVLSVSSSVAPRSAQPCTSCTSCCSGLWMSTPT
jgi:hypothetical protein